MSFESEIINDLNKKKLSEGSIKSYFNALKNLNDKKEIKNFKFLEKTNKILEKIKDFKTTTQRNIIIAIVSILKNKDKNLYDQYYKIMIDLNDKIMNESSKNEKSETQAKNWIKWDEVVSKFNELKNIKLSKNISETQYDNLLNLVVLALYVLIPPRRNKDYLIMKILNKEPIDNNYNYIDVKKKQFIFNNYKTKNTYGQQIINIPSELMEIIKKYLKYRKDANLKSSLDDFLPQKKSSTFSSDNEFFLVKFNGQNLKSDNSITRILNNIFNKNISSSMLRHIYLSSKYDDVLNEQKKDSEMMAHSEQTQKEYIKK